MSATGAGPAAVKKARHFTCDRCALKAASPIVVSKDKTRGEVALGVCSNVKACEVRQRRAAAAKAATS